MVEHAIFVMNKDNLDKGNLKKENNFDLKFYYMSIKN